VARSPQDSPRTVGEDDGVSVLGLTVPDELVEMIAQRTAAIVLERLSAKSEPSWLTFAKAADRLGCTTDAVRMRVNRGRLVTRHEGRRVYVSRQSVDGLS
jgi:hypothetical protein